jgi:hypothetical protein
MFIFTLMLILLNVNYEVIDLLPSEMQTQFIFFMTNNHEVILIIELIFGNLTVIKIFSKI